MDSFNCTIKACITPETAADFLKVSIFTIKRWLRSGELEGFKLVGNQWRTTYEACQKLLDKGKNNA